jgi:hypothetical protein
MFLLCDILLVISTTPTEISFSVNMKSKQQTFSFFKLVCGSKALDRFVAADEVILAPTNSKNFLLIMWDKHGLLSNETICTGVVGGVDFRQ